MEFCGVRLVLLAEVDGTTVDVSSLLLPAELPHRPYVAVSELALYQAVEYFRKKD